VCGTVAAMVSVNDFSDRPPRALADGQEVSLGTKKVRWIDAPHLPHNWECGYLFETTTRTLLCGDLFTQGGADNPPLTEGDILGPSEVMRKNMGGVALDAHARTLIEKLASTEPTTLATMHGSSYHGNGHGLLLAFASALGV
jgi:glyoxylase-like metal-dependent hydrolase (beta-lactamase superfamily II)